MAGTPPQGPNEAIARGLEGALTPLTARLQQARRLVVKLGSSSVADSQGQARWDFLRGLARELHALMEGPPRRQAILVSSGAVALGWPLLGFKRRPLALPDKQAAAAVGQARLMEVYRQVFEPLGRPVAQVLLTADDIRHRTRFTHAYRTLEALLSRGAVVVVNENDTVAVDEIRVGDNDTLSAMVAVMVEADLLVMLSDVDGIYTADPHRDPAAVRVPVVEDVEALSATLAEGRPGVLGTGGVRTKVAAARVAAAAGTAVVVARAEVGVVGRLLSGEPVGTLFVPTERVLRGKRRWLAFYAACQGRIVVDEGARRALVSGGKSLLLGGILAVDGDFPAGSVVQLVDASGVEFGRGVTAYDAETLRRLRFRAAGAGGPAGAGRATGGRGAADPAGDGSGGDGGLQAAGAADGRPRAWPPEVVHRDNLVITAAGPGRGA